jgi:hypothetical protein
MKNKIKAQSEFMKFLNKELKITIDDNIKPSPTTGNGLVARKLKEANEHLSKIKNLDEILKRYSSPE